MISEKQNHFYSIDCDSHLDYTPQTWKIVWTGWGNQKGDISCDRAPHLDYTSQTRKMVWTGWGNQKGDISRKSKKLKIVKAFSYPLFSYSQFK